jgi:hypothetical protein
MHSGSLRWFLQQTLRPVVKFDRTYQCVFQDSFGLTVLHVVISSLILCEASGPGIGNALQLDFWCVEECARGTDISETTGRHNTSQLAPSMAT